MNTHITMAFLKSIIFSNIMKVIPTNNDSSLHLHFLDHSSEDASSYRNVPSEWAFLVNVGSFQSLAGCFEAETDVAAVSHRLPPFGAQTFLSVKKDRGLLLERTLSLISHFAVLKDCERPN